MKGDFTRDTFDPRNHFTRVLTQQGRVQLDADNNEQVAILWHYLRTLAADLIGPRGGPNANVGFEITLDRDNDTVTDLKIGPGRYYVDGILCENDGVGEGGEEVEVTYYDQPGYPLDRISDELPDNLSFLVYLDVWENHVTAIEDTDIQEDALGGPDTATRAKVVWQVKVADKMPDESNIPNDISKVDIDSSWRDWEAKWQPANRGKLKAKAKDEPDPDTRPCIISPEARYRGAENQLYRVEIHGNGSARDDDGNGDGNGDSDSGGTLPATFKWSRDNGSVTFPVRELQGNVVTVEYLGRDSRLSLKVGDRVEIQDDDYVLQGRAESLLQVSAIDPISMQVTLDGALPSGVGRDPAKHPLLRRWDHGTGDSKKGEMELQVDGALRVKEDIWFTLEDGVQICFQPATGSNKPNVYRTGDYWLIPARTATGDVEWPGDVGQPEPRPPHGVEHHYAPLAVVVVSDSDDPVTVDCRSTFKPLSAEV